MMIWAIVEDVFFAEKSSSGLQKAILQLSHILRNEQKILKM